MKDDMSESDLSLPDDDSSFHPSDYSESSLDDRPVTKSRNKMRPNLSPIRSIHSEDVHQLNPTKTLIRKGGSINISASGSSSGSPWVDDTGSSSSTSSDASKSRILLSISEQIRFDEARERLKQSQKRTRSAQKNRGQTYDSSASVSTGKHPLKPIDVTDAHDTLMMPPILEKLRYTRQRYEVSTSSASMKSKEIVKIRNDVPTSRIVGVLPAISEGKNLKKTRDRNKGTNASSRSVPPIVVPEFCSPADDLSSLGVTFSYSKARMSNHRSRLECSDAIDIERGNANMKNENKSQNTTGWIEERTNLELCLIFSVAASFVALLALLIVIFARQ